MEQPIETIEHAGMTVKIYPDMDVCNPRTDFDNFGHMYCHHGRYDLGDNHSFDVPKVIAMAKSADYIALPLYLYDHSGITMNTTGFNCPWDSGMVGYIMVSKREVLKEYGGKIVTAKLRAKVIEYLKGEVETYDQYLTGQVYGYVVESPDGEHEDSCWGFYGFDSCAGEAKSVAEYWAKEREVCADLMAA